VVIFSSLVGQAASFSDAKSWYDSARAIDESSLQSVFPQSGLIKIKCIDYLNPALGLTKPFSFEPLAIKDSLFSMRPISEYSWLTSEGLTVFLQNRNLIFSFFDYSDRRHSDQGKWIEFGTAKKSNDNTLIVKWVKAGVMPAFAYSTCHLSF
jgi:hypothetical protein